MTTSSEYAGRAPAAAHAAVRTRRASRARPWVVGVLALLAAGAVLFGAGTGYHFTNVATEAAPSPLPELDVPADAKAFRQAEGRLKSRQKQLFAAIEKRKPKGTYIVIDQTQNRLYLMKDSEVVHEATCSAGSGMLLQETSTGREWVFDTPRGVFKVMNRIENPVWKKPDWAFVEEGKPIPKDPSERFDYGVLGEYALYFGNGYMIHGTLYERLLGRSVTHGCIRLGRDDLREVWRVASIGTPIYIY